MKDLLVFLGCGVYEVAVALVCLFLYNKAKVKAEIIRKIIHTATCLCTIPVLYSFSSLPWRLAGPAAFVVLNFLLSFLGAGKVLGITEKKRFMGLVYYPLSLFIMVLLEDKGILGKEAVLLGMLALGFGDGFAAMVGSSFGRHGYKVYGRYSKSIEGTATMALIVAVLAFFVGGLALPCALLLGVLSALIENFTPFGLDNLSVPILTAILTEVLCAL